MNGQVGNLGLTASQEADLVNFLMILSDGYTAPNPVGGIVTGGSGGSGGKVSKGNKGGNGGKGGNSGK
jgi:hypothetical protein